MEMTMNNIRPDTSNPADEARPHSATSRPAGRPGDDVVRWREFQLALWMGGFALTAMLGGFTFLYAAITDMRDELRVEIAVVNTEMREEIGSLREGIADLRDDVADVRERVHELSERVARIETRLDVDAGPADPAG